MYLLFDIGGTKMRLAVSEDLQSFEEPRVVPTPKNYEKGLSLFLSTAKELTTEKIKAVSGGIAGSFDGKKRSLLGSPQLDDWVGKPFAKELEKVFPAPVYIENDAALAGLGEAHIGAGRNKAIVAYITVSTGVGGARIVNGKIDEKAVGFEPGRQIIDAGKTICPECDSMRLGGMISGNALARRFGKKPEEIDDVEVWDDVAKFLSYGLHNVTIFWSPEVIVLGGSVTNKIDLEKVRKNLAETLEIFPELPELKRAELGDFGGLYGAMAFLRGKLGA
jgi:predicted NBD/HSP70 family sugar kinase